MRPWVAMGAVLALGVLCLLGAGGCKGGGPGTTAQATAEAFAKLVAAGDLKSAALCFDYVESARAQNENWDDIPAGQRDLIIRKLAEERAPELAAYKQALAGKVAASTNADGTVTLTGTAGAVNLSLIQQEGKYYISQIW
jgi:hypothetical protein